MGKPSRREIREALKKTTEDIWHSDQTALGISTDAAVEAVRKCKEAQR